MAFFIPSISLILGQLRRPIWRQRKLRRITPNWRRPPILYTYFDTTVNPATPNPALLNRLPSNVTHHLHGTPVSWATAAHGQMHFCGGENGNLRAWALGADRQSAYLGCSSAVASADSPSPAGGHAGVEHRTLSKRKPEWRSLGDHPVW